MLRFAKETEPECFIDIYLLQRTGSLYLDVGEFKIIRADVPG